MQKHSVNLLIKKEQQSPFLSKLQLILPILAVAALFLFVVIFLVSIIYIGNNNKQFGTLKLKVESLEREIAEKKNTEGIYTLTLNRVKTISEISAGSKNYSNLLSEILKLQKSGISVTNASIDKKNAINVSIIASSAATLDDFVETLAAAGESKKFSDVKSSGIVRDKSGGYLLTVSFKPSEALLK